MVKTATAPSSGRIPTRTDRRTPSLLDLWLTAFGKHQRHAIKHLDKTLQGEIDMAKGEQRRNREAKKPKKAKIRVIAAAPSQKAVAWQPTPAFDKRK
jgi:hypothetical protein